MNIVDQDGRRVFGKSLAESGDYVASKRFPTTLYAWRVQVAPTMAPLLSQKRATSRVNQIALIGLSVVVIFVAVGFILYAAAKERRVAELKSDFIATVSHELKTPLSVIRMFGEMLVTKRVADERKQQEYLEIICSESERLSGLIENVLDFAALERGKRRYEMRSCDIAEIAQRAIDTLRYRFEREGVSVKLTRVGDPPRGFVDDAGDPARRHELARQRGEVRRPHADRGHRGDAAREIQIRVRDRGPGIAQADRKRVFERFYRAKRARRSAARASASRSSSASPRSTTVAHSGPMQWAVRADRALDPSQRADLGGPRRADRDDTRHARSVVGPPPARAVNNG